MAFWDLLTVACMPIVNVLFISGLGAGLSTQYAGVLTEEIRRSLNKVVFTVFTPALMFASLAQSVTFDDLISWWSMPFNAFLTFFIGAILGWIIVKITKPPEYLNGIVVANCCGGNMGNLLIIVVPALCHERESPFGEPGICKLNGIAYVSLSMAIGSIFTWTYTYNLIRSASLINETKELENGLHENIPNINYLNAGETSKLLQRIVIIPAVPSSGGDYPSDKPKANGMVVFHSSDENPSCFQTFLRKGCRIYRWSNPTGKGFTCWCIFSSSSNPRLHFFTGRWNHPRHHPCIGRKFSQRFKLFKAKTCDYCTGYLCEACITSIDWNIRS